MAVRRHPARDEFLTGGSDGEPKLYKMIRTQARVIGDDFNRIRGYQPLPGRIFSLDFNKDGSQFVVGSSTGMGGAVRIYSTEDAKLLHELKGHARGVFVVAFRPDGQQVATGGFDGNVRLFDVATGQLVKQFVPVEISPAVATAGAQP
jgi:WD40 repeat protein